MQNMVDEITGHSRLSTLSTPDHVHAPSHASTTPGLPLINRQLMEPVPSAALMSMHHPPMHITHHPPPNNPAIHNDNHTHHMNYFTSPSVFSQSGGNRLSHTMGEIMGPMHHHEHSHHQNDQHGDHNPDMSYGHLPFTLPPPNRSHANM
jgi:hypothetical protein